MNKQPEKITLAKLEVVIMPNGEIIFLGKSVGMFKDLKKYLSEPKKEEQPLSRKTKYSGPVDLIDQNGKELNISDLNPAKRCP